MKPYNWGGVKATYPVTFPSWSLMVLHLGQFCLKVGSWKWIQVRDQLFNKSLNLLNLTTNLINCLTVKYLTVNLAVNYSINCFSKFSSLNLNPCPLTSAILSSSAHLRLLLLQPINFFMKVVGFSFNHWHRKLWHSARSYRRVKFLVTSRAKVGTESEAVAGLKSAK